jgi:hypothetical protein
VNEEEEAFLLKKKSILRYLCINIPMSRCNTYLSLSLMNRDRIIPIFCWISRVAHNGKLSSRSVPKQTSTPLFTQGRRESKPMVNARYDRFGEKSVYTSVEVLNTLIQKFWMSVFTKCPFSNIEIVESFRVSRSLPLFHYSSWCRLHNIVRIMNSGIVIGKYIWIVLANDMCIVRAW